MARDSVTSPAATSRRVTSSKRRSQAGSAARRRRWLIVALAALALLGTGTALAAVAGVPWWEDAAPPVNPRVLDWQLAPPVDGSSMPIKAARFAGADRAPA